MSIEIPDSVLICAARETWERGEAMEAAHTPNYTPTPWDRAPKEEQQDLCDQIKPVLTACLAEWGFEEEWSPVNPEWDSSYPEHLHATRRLVTPWERDPGGTTLPVGPPEEQ